MLNIQFFGTDIFSIKSLEAVIRVAKARPDLVSGLEVVTRSQKPSGRGQNTIVDSPIVDFARSNSIKWSQAETTSDFINLLDSKPSMAIAVSYGKLIPGQYLSQLRYGGLNVHPSLLPTYRGAAPLHRAILDRVPYTGVSVQTLDPCKFDRGKVLWQSPETPLDPSTTTQQLRLQLADLGSLGLEQVLTKALYLGSGIPTSYPKSWAKVVSKHESQINLASTVAQTIAQANALGKLYFEHPLIKKKKTTTSRTLVSDISVYNGPHVPENSPFSIHENSFIIKLADGCIAAHTVQAAGFGPESPEEYNQRKSKRGIQLIAI